MKYRMVVALTFETREPSELIDQLGGDILDGLNEESVHIALSDHVNNCNPADGNGKLLPCSWNVELEEWTLVELPRAVLPEVSS